MATKGARYCSFMNCSTNTRTSIDPRTGARPKFHKFPDPEKDRERCLKWISYSRRGDLNLKNVKQKLVCALHFNLCDYNYPDDIATSTLLPRAVPTIVDCSNPPKTSTSERKPPCPRDWPEVKTEKVDPASSSSSDACSLSLPPESVATTPLPLATMSTIPTATYQALLAKISSLEGDLKTEKRCRKRLATNLCAQKISCQRLKQQNERLKKKVSKLEDQLKSSLLNNLLVCDVD